MGTVPSPHTWNDDNNNTKPTATQFNEHIRDTINFFVNPPRVLVRSTQNQTLSGETWTVLNWNTTVYQSESGMHNPNSNSGRRLVAQTAGIYQVHLQVRWEDQYDPGSPLDLGVLCGPRSILIRKNSGGSVASGTEVATDRRRVSEHQTSFTGVGAQSCVGFVYLNGSGDYVEAFARCGERDFTISDVGFPPASPPYPGVPVNMAIWHDPPSSDVADVRFGMVWVHP